MIKQLPFTIKENLNEKDKALIEVELGVMEGVRETKTKGNQVLVDFDDGKINADSIKNKINELGLGTEQPENIKEQVYKVSGMHCGSCELIIEKKVIELNSVEAVDASASQGRVMIEYSGKKPEPEELNKLFQQEGYRFSSASEFKEEKQPEKNWTNSVIAALVIMAGFLLLNKTGFTSFFNVNSTSSIGALFTLGLLAGVSTCAALTGGIVLSMAKQWFDIYGEGNKIEPHLLFNSGRIVSFSVLGFILGSIGGKLSISPEITAFLTIAVSILMVLMALNMLGFSQFNIMRFIVPKTVMSFTANEKNFTGKQTPFLMGALTFLLPCGFTITAESIALLSGSGVKGAMVMGSFVLGTALPLIGIGVASVKMFANKTMALNFSRVAGFLVLFFAIFNINSQMNVLGVASLADFIGAPKENTSGIEKNTDSNIKDGIQIIKMSASARGYTPNYFKVKAGVPVRWEITDTGTSGCTNAVISRSLFDGQIDLVPGTTSVKEFTPQKPGKYKFSCWMGMVSGIMEVVDSTAKINDANVVNAQETIPSGAKGCGCGGATSCGGGK
ncbi:MAG: sulfite exporter TauE/SafE family protein [Patescibacteria group bacterium]